MEDNEENIIKNEKESENDFDLKNVYEDEIFEVIKRLEIVSKKISFDISRLSNNFITKNELFSKEIKEHIKNQALKFNDIFNLDNKSNDNKDNNNSNINLKIITKKTIKLVKNIMIIYEKLFTSLKDNINIMFNFFNITKYINNAKPIQDFLSLKFDDIAKCWLFMEIDFENFDFNKALNNSKLDQDFKRMISYICKKKYITLNLIYKKGVKNMGNFDENKKLLEKQTNLIKLNIENADNLNNIITEKIQFTKLKKFYLKNTSISNKKNTILKKMESLEKLSIKSCPTINVNMLSSLPKNIRKLYLEKNNFIDEDFMSILKILLSNEKILDNLEILSFAGNKITTVDLSKIPSRYIFQSLKELNFNKNKIFKFIYNKNNNFKSLKFINCCNNYLNKSYLSSFDKIIGLESGNIFLLDSDLSDKYYSQLKTKLMSNNKNHYMMSYLNITYIPKKKTLDFFNDFNIIESIMINLRKLDLSYTGLNCDIFFKFIGQNKGFISLRSLKLNGNLLDDTFFEKYLQYINIFNKLEHLYLNVNNIGDPNIKINYKDGMPINEIISRGNKDLVYKLRLIYLFIQKNINLTKLTITRNPISKMFIIKNDFKNNIGKANEYIERDNNNHIIINCFHSLLVKIRDELLVNKDEIIKRNHFNIRFDCCTNVNINSENYFLSNKSIIFKDE